MNLDTGCLLVAKLCNWPSTLQHSHAEVWDQATVFSCVMFKFISETQWTWHILVQFLLKYWVLSTIVCQSVGCFMVNMAACFPGLLLSSITNAIRWPLGCYLFVNFYVRIIEPITSRCAKFRFKQLTVETICKRLKYIATQESVHIDDEVGMSLNDQNEFLMLSDMYWFYSPP